MLIMKNILTDRAGLFLENNEEKINVLVCEHELHTEIDEVVINQEGDVSSEKFLWCDKCEKSEEEIDEINNLSNFLFLTR